ncbi:unnamed protein product, partial [Nezara viridula]
MGPTGTPVVLPVYPTTRSTVPPPPHYSPYSPSRFNIDKRCKHSCSWKCTAIALILLSVALSAMVAYFAGRLESQGRKESGIKIIRERMAVKYNILEIMEERRLQWYGHERMNSERLPKTAFEWKAEGSR